MRKLSDSQKAEVNKLDETLPDQVEAIESGYRSPTPEDIKDIRHDHNTAGPGAVTADEAVREVTDARERQRIDAEEEEDASLLDLRAEQEGDEDPEGARNAG